MEIRETGNRKNRKISKRKKGKRNVAKNEEKKKNR
jgi:hypothetical protein